jgi:hypothetical protein
MARVFPRDSLHLQTISRTLGAAFAVLAAFVIYRFQTDPAMGHAVAQMLEMFNRDPRAIRREAQGIFTFCPTFEKLRTDFRPNWVPAGTRPVAS